MRKILLTLTFIFFCSISVAQQEKDSLPSSVNPFNNWTLGGNIGVTAGSHGLGVFVTPRVGYKITEDFEVAVNINYTLQNTEYYTNKIIGTGPSLNYYIQRNFYVMSSFQHYFISQKNKASKNSHTRNENALYVGGGYMQHLGRNTYMQLGFSYNILYRKNESVFSTGFIPNVGIVFGL